MQNSRSLVFVSKRHADQIFDPARVPLTPALVSGTVDAGTTVHLPNSLVARNAKEPDEQKINWLELELEFLLARAGGGGPVIRGAR